MSTDLRFNDVVIESGAGIGRKGRYHSAICKTCSTRHKVVPEEFEVERLFDLDGSKYNPLLRVSNDAEIMEYVAGMRAWNCCHEEEEPLDGFPEKPDTPSRIEFDNI